MGKKNGYILLFRSIMDNWLWSSKPFSKGQAWIDLLLLANYEDRKTMHRGKLKVCKRGTVNLSVSVLAERWGWNWRTAKNFILELEKDGMCTLDCTRDCTTITIVNYDDFQDSEKRNTKRNTKQNTNRSAEAVQNGVQITKEIKEVKNENKENTAAPLPSEEPDETWNGKRIEDLTYEEWCAYVDSWPEDKEE